MIKMTRARRSREHN